MLIDSGMKFSDIILRVAEEWRWHKSPVSGGAAEIPTDAYVLDRVKRAINDGREEMYRLFMAAKAPCMEIEVSFTLSSDGTAGSSIGGDAGRYALDTNIELPAQDSWSWSLASGAEGGLIEARAMADVAAMLRADPGATGSPRFYAIATRRGDTLEASRGMEIRFYPRPDRDYLVAGMAVLGFYPLMHDDEREPTGSAHSRTVIAAANMLMARNMDNLAMRDRYEADFKSAVAVSLGIENRKRPKILGMSRDPSTSGHSVMFDQESYARVAQYNGVDLN